MKLFSKGTLGREKQIGENFDRYLDGLGQIGLRLREAFDSYMKGDEQGFSSRLVEINALEHRLDGIRRGIEMEIYGRRLLPDTRGDVLSLLENVDKIPNRIQSATRGLMLQRAQVPDPIKEDVMQLVDHINDAIRIVIEVAHAFLNRPARVKELVGRLSEIEHEADIVEHRAIAVAFDDPDRELAHKLQLQGLIERVGSICDLAEDVGDRVMISSLKRVL